jgi:AbrB family looped-hinge helix DNA binding protein
MGHFCEVWAMKEKKRNRHKDDADARIVYGVAKVSPKGQIVIPADLRTELCIKQGDQLLVTKSSDGEGILLMKMGVLNRLISRTRYDF